MISDPIHIPLSKSNQASSQSRQDSRVWHSETEGPVRTTRNERVRRGKRERGGKEVQKMRMNAYSDVHSIR